MVQIDQVIETDGDTWQVLAVGAEHEDTGEVIVHLKSTTRVLPGVKRDTPVQTNCWINPTTFKTRSCRTFSVSLRLLINHPKEDAANW